MSNIVLQAVEVSKSFQQAQKNMLVLDRVNFSISRGEQIAILGRSGSGKTTLLQLLGGIDRPSSGQVSLLGKNLNDCRDTELDIIRNNSIGFVYQFHHLLPEFTAIENIAMPLFIRREKKACALQQAREILSAIDMLACADKMPNQLSGGERQRVAIARALITRPACVLADEPTGSLDVDTAKLVFSQLLNLNREQKTCSIIVTHDIDLAKNMDKCYFLDKGRLLAYPT